MNNQCQFCLQNSLVNISLYITACYTCKVQCYFFRNKEIHQMIFAFDAQGALIPPTSTWWTDHCWAIRYYYSYKTNPPFIQLELLYQGKTLHLIEVDDNLSPHPYNMPRTLQKLQKLILFK